MESTGEDVPWKWYTGVTGALNDQLAGMDLFDLYD
jgi:hypothetical protein